MWSRDVTLVRRGAVALLVFFLAQWVEGTFVFAQTLIVPSISASETYDSNVFYTPKTLLGPDQKPEDFVTTVTPQINFARAGSLMRAGLSVGASIAKYLHNPDLDYTGVNAAGTLDFKSAASKLSQRITTLTVNGIYQFTPSMSGFSASTGGGLGTGFGGTQVGALNSGLVTNRVSMNTYNLGVTGGYQLTRVTTLLANYTYTKVSFGKQSGGVDNQLFDTTGHQGTTTISTQISARDTVGATATMSHYIQEQASGSSGQGSFTTIAETLNWARLWTQKLSTSLGGGGILTLPIGSSIPGQSIKSQFAPTATATMTYSSFSEGLRAAGSSVSPFDGLPSLAGMLNPGGINAAGGYTAAMSYNFSIFPSYAFGSGPIKTHVVGVNASAGLTSKLTAQVGANYSHGTTSFPTSTFDTVGLTAGARYLIGPVLASLTYDWLYFSSSTAQSPLSQNSQSDEYAFSKKMVMLSFSYAFTSQSFFRMDQFGFGGQSSGSGGTTSPSSGELGSGAAGTGLGK